MLTMLAGNFWEEKDQKQKCYASCKRHMVEVL